MIYTCKRCNKELCTKQSLERHLNKKYPCNANNNISRESLLQELNESEVGHKCSICDLAFTSRQAKYRHMKTHCNTSSVIEERIKNIELLLHGMVRHNHNTVNISGNINNNITVQLNNFGQENMEFLNADFLTQCMLSCNNGIKNLMKEIHFNPDIPENHNIRLLSKKQNLLEKYVDGVWHPCDKNNTLDEMIRQGYRILFKHLSEHNNTITDDQESIQRSEYVNMYLNKIMRRDGNVYYELRRDLYMMILDGTLYILGR